MCGNQHNRRFLVAISLLIATVLAVATVVAAQVPHCAPGQLSDYERLGAKGCAIGDKHFSNFTYHKGPNGLPADAISVTPGTVTDSDDPALLFEATWVTPSVGSAVSYGVEVAPGGKPISGASLEMQFGQITGTGETRVAAELHQSTDSPGSCGPTLLELDVFLGASQLKKATDSGQLKDPARQLCVVSPVSVAPGKNGTASLKGFMTVFHSSPAQPGSANNATEPSPTGVGQ